MSVVRVVLLCASGITAGALVAMIWLTRLEQSLGTSCDLGCVVFFPLVPGLAVAGGVAGAISAVRGWAATGPGWAALAVLAAAAVVLPQALALLLLAPVELGFGLWATTGVVLVASVAFPLGAFLAACRLFRRGPGRMAPT